jgi:TRAP-type uncharacterized transport system substrate-binding protein
MERVIAALGLTRSDFADVRELSPAEQSRAFCANEVDAIVYSVAQPNGLTALGILAPGQADDRQYDGRGSRLS